MLHRADSRPKCRGGGVPICRHDRLRALGSNNIFAR